MFEQVKYLFILTLEKVIFVDTSQLLKWLHCSKKSDNVSMDGYCPISNQTEGDNPLINN